MRGVDVCTRASEGELRETNSCTLGVTTRLGELRPDKASFCSRVDLLSAGETTFCLCRYLGDNELAELSSRVFDPLTSVYYL